MPIQKKEEIKIRECKLWGKTVKTKFAFFEQICKKLNNGYSPLIGICGPQRAGKSTIALWLALKIHEASGQEFNMEKMVFYEPDKAIENLTEKNQSVEWIDEPDALDYQEWYKQTHRAMRSMINTQGYKNNLYIVISPFIAQLDKSLRVHIDYLIDVKSRGHFLVWKTKKKYKSGDLNKAAPLFLIDDCNILLTDIPLNYRREYLKFSIQEKERIRKSRLMDGHKSRDYDLSELIELSKRVKNG